MIAGLVLLFEGIRRKFLKYLQLSRVSPRTRRIVERLGMIGTAARGAVFALAGILVLEAAVTYKPCRVWRDKDGRPATPVGVLASTVPSRPIDRPRACLSNGAKCPIRRLPWPG